MFSVVRKNVAFFLDACFLEWVTHSDFVLVDCLGIKVVSLGCCQPSGKTFISFWSRRKPNDSFAHRVRFARISSVTGRAAGDASILCLQLLCFDIFLQKE